MTHEQPIRGPAEPAPGPGGQVRRRSCSSQPVCSLVRRSPQPAHVTWCPDAGEESLHFPPAWRNQSLCVSWKIVSLAVICCPELMRHILESASRILRAPRCNQKYLGAPTTSTSPSEATVSRTCSSSLLVYSIIGEVFPCHETDSQSVGKLFPRPLGLPACSAGCKSLCEDGDHLFSDCLVNALATTVALAHLPTLWYVGERQHM
jgi:hypothetical protein